jgi:hypothetical protein
MLTPHTTAEAHTTAEKKEERVALISWEHPTADHRILSDAPRAIETGGA